MISDDNSTENNYSLKESDSIEQRDNLYIGAEVEGAKRSLDLLCKRGHSGDSVPLYIGVEGGSNTEAVVTALLQEIGVKDPRIDGVARAAEQPGDAVFESPPTHWVAVRLTRINCEDDTSLIELDAVRL